MSQATRYTESDAFGPLARPGDRRRRRHAGQPVRHPGAGRLPRWKTAGSAAETLAGDDWDRIVGHHPGPQLPDGTAEELLPRLKATGAGGRRADRHRLRRPEGAIAAMRQGAADYILKPINPDALRASLTASSRERRPGDRPADQGSSTRGRLPHPGRGGSLPDRHRCGRDLSIASTSARVRRRARPATSASRGRSARTIFDGSLPGKDRPASEQRDAACGASWPASRHAAVENAIVCRDGSTAGSSGTRSPCRTTKAAPASWCVGQDITEPSSAPRSRPLQSERLAAIGQMMTGLAHESGNALARSQACLEMLPGKWRTGPRPWT